MTAITLCGSRRFELEIRRWAGALRDQGLVVYEPYLHKSTPEEWAAVREDHRKFISLGLTLDHFYKLEMADVVFVYNPDGYAGVSTTMEIGYAAALRKPIYAFSPDDQEAARRCLFRGYATTVGQLIELLGLNHGGTKED